MASVAATLKQGLNVAGSVGSIIATPFQVADTVRAYNTQAGNAAATASALREEKSNFLRIFDRETKTLASQQTLGYIMSGLSLEDGGTPQNVMDISAKERAIDRAATARNYDTQIANAERAEEAAKKSKKNALFGGIAQAVGTAASLAIFSDERLKQNLICVGRSRNGLNIYLGRYTKESGLDDGNLHLFLIAQEVQKIVPEAVVENANGYLMVDYAKALL